MLDNQLPRFLIHGFNCCAEKLNQTRSRSYICESPRHELASLLCWPGVRLNSYQDNPERSWTMHSWILDVRVRFPIWQCLVCLGYHFFSCQSIPRFLMAWSTSATSAPFLEIFQRSLSPCIGIQILACRRIVLCTRKSSCLGFALFAGVFTVRHTTLTLWFSFEETAIVGWIPLRPGRSSPSSLLVAQILITLARNRTSTRGVDPCQCQIVLLGLVSFSEIMARWNNAEPLN